MSSISAYTPGIIRLPQLPPEPAIFPLDYDKGEIQMTASFEMERIRRCRACSKEPWTVEWIESMQPGDVLYDVGASTGPYSLVAASRGIRTFAFEPGYANYPRLVEHTTMNRLSRLLTPLPIALSSRTGLGLMNYANRYPGGSCHTFWTLAEGKQEEALAFQPVFQQYALSFRMDDLPGYDPLILSPTHIKLDVDGAEADVLDGAWATLQGGSFRELLMEMHTGEEEMLTAKAQSLGLTLAERFDTSTSEWVRQDVAYGLFRRAA